MDLKTFNNGNITTKYHVDDDKLRHGQYVIDYYGKEKLTAWYLHGLLTDYELSKGIAFNNDDHQLLNDLTHEEVISIMSEHDLEYASTSIQKFNKTLSFKDLLISDHEGRDIFYTISVNGYISKKHRDHWNDIINMRLNPTVNLMNMNMAGSTRRITEDRRIVQIMSYDLMTVMLKDRINKIRYDALHTSWRSDKVNYKKLAIVEKYTIVHQELFKIDY